MSVVFDTRVWKRQWDVRIWSRVPLPILTSLVASHMQTHNFLPGHPVLESVIQWGGWGVFFLIGIQAWGRVGIQIGTKRWESERLALMGINTGYVHLETRIWSGIREVGRGLRDVLRGLWAALEELWAALLFVTTETLGAIRDGVKSLLTFVRTRGKV